MTALALRLFGWLTMYDAEGNTILPRVRLEVNRSYHVDLAKYIEKAGGLDNLSIGINRKGLNLLKNQYLILHDGKTSTFSKQIKLEDIKTAPLVIENIEKLRDKVDIQTSNFDEFDW